MKTLEEALAKIAELEKQNATLAGDLELLKRSNHAGDQENQQLRSQLKAVAAAKSPRPLLDESGEKLLAEKRAAGLPLETALEVVKAQQANDAQKKKTAKA